jgi:membrane fusion protein (multidrug efflux system)
MQLPPGMAMFDPLMVPVPPELAPAVYAWIRRLALQNDLATADRVLRDALLELSSSLSVTVVYPGADGLWSLGSDEEVPKDPGPMIACAQARKALVSSHSAIIPIVTTTETVAVVVLTRNPRNPAFHPLEALAALGFARESAAIMHHLSTAHLTKQAERASDKGSLYRGEALEAHRNRGTEGPPISLSPGWVKRTYPFLLGALLIAIVFCAFIKVPTYASGQGVIIIDGDAVSSPVQGTVAEVIAKPQTSVKKGAIILKLDSQPERDELTTLENQYNDWATAFLFDPTDENNKKQLGEKYAQLDQARKRVEQKTIRAPRDGVISDIRPTKGTLVTPGDPVATIVQPGAPVQVIAFLPATDLPQLRATMEMQIDILGFTKVHEKAPIIEVNKQAIAGSEVVKLIGPSLANAIKLPEGGTYAVVKARMKSNQFQSTHRKYFYFTGMQVKTDVLVSEKPFLAQLLPALEKWIPD